MAKFYLEILEEGNRLATGRNRGYDRLEEASAAASRHVDDAPPHNIVRILQHVATAFLRGDGDPEVRQEESESDR